MVVRCTFSMIVLYIVRYKVSIIRRIIYRFRGHMSLADTQYLGIIENIL